MAGGYFLNNLDEINDTRIRILLLFRQKEVKVVLRVAVLSEPGQPVLPNLTIIAFVNTFLMFEMDQN